MSEKKQWHKHPLYITLGLISSAVMPMLVVPVGNGLSSAFSSAGKVLARGAESVGLSHPHRTYFFPKENIQLTCNDTVNPNGTATDRVQVSRWGTTNNGGAIQTSYYREHTYSAKGDDPNGYQDKYNVGVLSIEYNKQNEVINYKGTISPSLASASLSGAFDTKSNPLISLYFHSYDLVANGTVPQAASANTSEYKSPSLKLFGEIRQQLGPYAVLCGKGNDDSEGTEHGGKLTLGAGETDIFQRLNADIEKLGKRPPGGAISTQDIAAFNPPPHP